MGRKYFDEKRTTIVPFLANYMSNLKQIIILRLHYMKVVCTTVFTSDIKIRAAALAVKEYA